MPKPLVKDAPPNVLVKLERTRSEYAAEHRCRAAGQLVAIQLANRLGYYVPAENVDTPCIDELREIEARGDTVGAARFKTTASFEIKYERMCLDRARAMARWATEPTETERAESARTEREAAEREAAIERRAQEIAAEQEADRHKRALVKARAQAEKEVTG
jgi:hypothetical protein